MPSTKAVKGFEEMLRLVKMGYLFGLNKETQENLEESTSCQGLEKVFQNRNYSAERTFIPHS